MKRRDEVLVGIVLTVALLVGIVGTIWLVRGGLRSGYPLYAKFPWGEGLKQGQPVFLVGVNVGYVDDIILREDGTLVVAMKIGKDYHVPAGSTARVENVGFFGDRAIALEPKAGPQRRYIPPGDTVPAGPPSPSLDVIIARADTMTRHLAAITDAARTQLVDEGGIRDLRSTLAATNRLVAQLGQVVAVQSRELASTQASLRRTLAGVDSAKIDSTLVNFRTASANAARLTSDLSTQLTATTARINGLLDRVEKGDGTAAKLLNDPGLYEDVRGLVQRVDSLTADLKKNPKKYINVRIF